MPDPKATAEQVTAWTKITALVLGHAMVEMGKKLIASVDDVDPGRGAEFTKHGWVCNQKGCDEPAEFRYRWPTGEGDKYSCGPHAQHAKLIGESLGYPITLEPIGCANA
jgi:hypothetical protein